VVFGIFATIAEFERELIRDRVRSGIASARGKGKRIGRPKVVVDSSMVAAMRDAGASWDTIRRELDIGKGTAQRALVAKMS
jgi:putative DNA-invertase from lambdoid prophage Rac